MTPLGNSANTPKPLGTSANTPTGSIASQPPKSTPDLPYLALSTDKKGEPFYGGGFSGWARRAIANVFDPRFLTSGMDEKQKANYLSMIPRYEDVINRKTLWDSWAGPLFGISAKNLAEAGAAFSAEADTGDKAAQVTGTAVRGIKQGLFGAMGLAQGLEYTVRQIGAASKSLEEFANTSGIEDKDLNPFGNKFWNGKILQGFDSYASYFPGLLDIGYDIYRIYAGNPDWESADEIFQKHWKSASAIYTMAWTPMLAAEFERRYQSGEDPYKIAYEVQNPWVELSAGLLLDPLNYMGIGLPGKFGKASQAFKLADKLPFGAAIAKKVPFMKKTLFNIPWEVVYRTPEFGEIIGLGKLFGKGKIETRALSKTEAMPELKALLKQIEKGSSDEAIQDILLKGDDLLAAAQKKAQAIGTIKNPHSLLALRAEDRYYSLATRAQNFDSWILKNVKGNYDEALEVYADLVKFRNGDADLRNVAFMNLAKRGMAEALFSEEAFEMAFLVDKLYDNGKIIEIAKGPNAVENMLGHLKNLMEDLAPTVTEMRKAAKLTPEELAKLGPEELIKAQRLASQYKEVGVVAKVAERVSSVLNKGFNPVMRYQGTMFFTLSPMYPIKNALGNFSPMAIDLGIEVAGKTLTEALGAASNEKVVNALVDAKMERVKDAIGIIPSKMKVAFARMTSGQVSAKNKLFAKASNLVEEVFSASIVENVVLDGARKIRRNAIYPEMKPVLDKLAMETNEQTAFLFIKKIEDNNGNVDKAIPEFLDAIKEGYIESWRHQVVEPNLQMLLDKTGGSAVFNDMLAAKTPEEMLAKQDELIKFLREKGNQAGLEKPVAQLSPEDEKIAAELGDDIGVDFFKASTNAWRTANMNMDTVIGHYQGELGKLAQQGLIPQPVYDAEIAELNRMKNVFDSQTIDTLDSFRDFIRSEIVARARNNAPVSELWNMKFNFKKPELDPNTGQALLNEAGNVVYRDDWFSLKDTYPNVPEKRLTSQDLVDLAWRSYFPTRTREYTLGKSGLLDAVLNKMRNNQFGVDFDGMAARLGQGERQANPLKEIEKYRQMAIGYARDAEFARLLSASGSTSTALVDYAMRVGLPGGKPETIVNVVNKYNPRTSIPMPKNVQKEFDDITRQMETIGRSVPPESAAEVASLRQQLSALQNEPGDHMDEIIAIRQKINDLSTPPELKALQERRAALDNKYQPEGGVPYTTVDEIPFEEGVKGLEAFAAEHGRRVWAFNPDGMQSPSAVRALYESREYYEAAINAVVKKAQGDWGKITPTSLPKKAILDEFRTGYKEKMASSELYLGELANEMRDFILHSYEKSYLDLAVGYVLPYQYWQTRTYKKFMERAVSNPAILANYARYKNTLSKLHAGMPEWWKQNIPIYGLPGMNPDEPLFFNLEASLNPVNGITGVDFNDPYKRVNWWTKVVDDMNSFGPSMAMPLNWAMGLALYNQGEKDAAARWMGRLFPQSQAIKSALTLAGVKPTGLTPYNEVDPFTNIMSGGLDPYEQRRVHRALAGMVNEGMITDEQAYDAAYFKDETWDKAVEMSIKGRAPANLASFFLGVGFKPRTENDMLIDKFYSDYGKLVQTKDNISPEAYKNSLAALRQQYPFMDTLLVSKNYGEERETSYAYGILSRIPPGQSDDLLQMVGIDQTVVDKFYENKGDMTKMTVPERELFMAAVVNLGALLAIPESATSVEWNRAKTAYSQIYTDAEAIYGKDIWQKVDTYYGLLDQNSQVANDFLDSHAEVQEVITYKQKALATNPDAYKYYGSIDVIQRYYDTKLREQLVKEFGEEIYAQFTEYGLLKQWDDLNGTKTANAYYKAHPALKEYGKVKKKYQDQINRMVIQVAKDLPERPNVLLREDIQAPQGIQQQFAEQLNPPQKTWQDWQKELSPPMQRMIVAYFTQGETLEYNTMDQLDYLAEKKGMTGNELLQQIGQSLYQAGGQPLASNP